VPTTRSSLQALKHNDSNVYTVH